MNSSNYTYFADPGYQDIRYTIPTQIYYLIFGTMSILLNLYLILLFAKYHKLRINQCNWLIIFLCASNVLIGLATFMRAATFLYAINEGYINFGLVFCTIFFCPFACGFRIGQTIALLVAFDRFLAIWKPVFYAHRQGKVRF
jgi:hypothetical protein